MYYDFKIIGGCKVGVEFIDNHGLLLVSIDFLFVRLTLSA